MPGDQPEIISGAYPGECVNRHQNNPNGTRKGNFLSFARDCLENLKTSRILLIASTGLSLFPGIAQANEATEIPVSYSGLAGFFETMETGNILMLAMFGGAMSFSLLSATWLIRERAKLVSNNQKLKQSIADLRASNDRNEALVGTSDQRIVVWNGGEDTPVVLGSLSNSTGAPDNHQQFLEFTQWVENDFARTFQGNIRELRSNARNFETVLKTKGGGLLEVSGGTSGSYAFVRFRNLTAVRKQKAEIEADFESLNNSFAKIESLLTNLPMPVWLKDIHGKLVWVNRSYANALEIDNPNDAVAGNIDLFDSVQRETLQDNLEHNKLNETLISATVAGDRKKLQVFNIGADSGSAGIAIDKSDAEDVRRMLKETNESHSRMLDQLATAVAIFDKSQHLTFYNDSFRRLWKFDAAFLDSGPCNGEILDAMRDEKLLPEHPDWRKWRNAQLDIYTAIEPVEEWWHLLDGQTIRVVAAPRSQGGSTWIFENVTERLALESNYNSLMRIQGETLDHLNEAVAVFGSNGQLKLFNPALEALWSDSDMTVQEGIHITSVIEAWTKSIPNSEDLEKILGQVTGFDDARETINGRMKLIDDSTIQYTVVPLPEGQSMLTLVDVTANVNFERALHERAEALEASDLLKSRFIQHVSYELRAPLTSISGFGQMLSDMEIGKLNAKQTEYISHINDSADILREIVDDILDLASIDAGTMVLDYSSVRIAEIVENAFQDFEDVMREKGLRSEIDVSSSSDTLTADEDRLMQVIKNLISNAINFSPDGGRISVTATSNSEHHEIRISDEGPGIDASELEIIFDRFESRAPDGSKSGTGLGLSLVQSLIEMHGGKVEVDQSGEVGTCFVCRLPVAPLQPSDTPDNDGKSVANAA